MDENSYQCKMANNLSPINQGKGQPFHRKNGKNTLKILK